MDPITLQSFFKNEYHGHDTSWMNHYEYNILAPYIVSPSSDATSSDVMSSLSCDEMLRYYRDMYFDMRVLEHNIYVILLKLRESITYGPSVVKFLSDIKSYDFKSYAIRKTYDYLKKKNDENGDMQLKVNRYRLEYARKQTGVTTPNPNTIVHLLPGYGSYVDMVSFEKFPAYYEKIRKSSPTCYTDEIVSLVALFKLEKKLSDMSKFLIDTYNVLSFPQGDAADVDIVADADADMPMSSVYLNQPFLSISSFDDPLQRQYAAMPMMWPRETWVNMTIFYLKSYMTSRNISYMYEHCGYWKGGDNEYDRIAFILKHKGLKDDDITKMVDMYKQKRNVFRLKPNWTDYVPFGWMYYLYALHKTGKRYVDPISILSSMKYIHDIDMCYAWVGSDDHIQNTIRRRYKLSGSRLSSIMTMVTQKKKMIYDSITSDMKYIWDELPFHFFRKCIIPQNLAP